MIARARDFVQTTLKEWVAQYWIPVLAAAILLGIAVRLVDPAPPKRVVLTAGSEEGDFQKYAERYKKILAKDGITLEVLDSKGAMENLKRLRDPKEAVTLGFLQDGLATGTSEAPAADALPLVSLGSVYYTPLWIFYRAEAGAPSLTRLAQLQGKRIATGRFGSGATELSVRLLAAAGLDPTQTIIIPTGGAEAAQALLDDAIDVVFFLGPPEMAEVKQLIRAPNIRLMGLEDAEAFARNFHYLKRLTLPKGSLDLAKQLPPTNLDLLAPTVVLAAREGVHPALGTALARTLTEVHSTATLLSPENLFPSDLDRSLPMLPEVKRYYKSGPPFLQRFLPFWLATWIDRTILILLPLIAILIPISRIAPAVYSWHARSRVYRWYGELKFLENQLAEDKEPANLREHLPQLMNQLDEIEDKVNEIRLPLAFSNHLYFLREHIELVRNKLMKAEERLAARARGSAA
jgi:TRAP-type uncharacterized transport system substrate-binding protein